MFGFGAFGEFAFGETPGGLITPIFEDAWHQQFSDPARYRLAPKAAIAIASWSAFVVDPFILTRPEVVSADRFVRPFSEPVRFPQALPTRVQQFAAFVKADPFPELVSADRFVPPFSQPVLFVRGHQSKALPTHAQQFAAFVKADPFPELVSADRWWRVFDEPTRFPRGHQSKALPTYAQQFAAFAKADPFLEMVSVDRWWRALNEPTRFRRALPTAQQKFQASLGLPFSGFEQETVSVLGTATLSAAALTTNEAILSDENAVLVYTAEIHPWVLAGRA